MVQLAKLPSTAKTARPIAGKKIKGHVARVGATPWKLARQKRGASYRRGAKRAIIT